MPRPRRSAPPRSVRPLRLAGLVLIGAVVIIGLVIGLSSGSSTQRGYDVSYPQCGTSLPSGSLFGIVGVNGGLANRANPCLAHELTWARAAPGQRSPNQPRLSFYIDTANPGPQASDWPRRGTTPAYGTCNAKLTDACSYLYGEARAADSARRALSLDRAEARTAPWWLDVELMASWAETYQLNIAALQGFIAGLHLSGITGPVGVYSTPVQWRDLTGLSARTTPTAFNAAPADWVAGTTATLDEARRACVRDGFSGMAPTLAQYQAGGHDADLRCPGAS